MMILVFWYF